MNHLAVEIQAQCGLNVFTNPQIAQRLRLECERAKRDLTDAEQTEIHFDVCGLPFNRTLSRSEFENIIAPVIERTRIPCLKALKDAGVTASEIDEVV